MNEGKDTLLTLNSKTHPRSNKCTHNHPSTDGSLNQSNRRANKQTSVCLFVVFLPPFRPIPIEERREKDTSRRERSRFPSKSCGQTDGRREKGWMECQSRWEENEMHAWMDDERCTCMQDAFFVYIMIIMMHGWTMIDALACRTRLGLAM